MEECIFCKIVKGDIPTEKLFEDDYIIAFNDINPKAPTHVLIIPKAHRESLSDLTKEETYSLFQAANKLSKDLNVDKTGFRLAMNLGKHSGQIVEHLHFHLLGGKPSTCLY